MKLSLVLGLAPAVMAFAPTKAPIRTDVKLEATRRDVLFGIAAATALTQPAVAKQAGIGADWGFIDDEVVAAQMPTGNKIDVNNAAIVSYLNELQISLSDIRVNHRTNARIKVPTPHCSHFFLFLLSPSIDELLQDEYMQLRGMYPSAAGKVRASTCCFVDSWMLMFVCM